MVSTREKHKTYLEKINIKIIILFRRTSSSKNVSYEEEGGCSIIYHNNLFNKNVTKILFFCVY